jgi:hypothetical protein
MDNSIHHSHIVPYDLAPRPKPGKGFCTISNDACAPSSTMCRSALVFTWIEESSEAWGGREGEFIGTIIEPVSVRLLW